MSRDALKKASREEVKTFARQIISKQQKDIAMMKGWKSAWAGAAHGGKH